MTSLDRRTILKTGGALALASALPSEASAQAVKLRPNISSLTPNDPILVSYRTAINAMKALPQSDPRNWTRQAQIHQGNNVVRCPHGNWYFLPWHRAYLLAFERICRQLSGNQNFALPYWDWTANPQLPAAFAAPTFNGQPNALFNNTRSSQTVTIPANIAGAQVISNILAETTFEIFASSRPNGQNNTAQQWQIAFGLQGPLKSGPHNNVHGRISGNMGTFMSPLDPIFWLHHCNIDRLWDRWNRMGRANTNDPLWRNFAFNNQFVVPSGNASAPFNTPVSGLLNIQQLGYRYTLPIFVPPNILVARRAVDLRGLTRVAPVAGQLESVQVTTTEVARINQPLTLDVKLSPTQAAALKKIQLVSPAPESARPVQAEGRVLAVIRGVETPANGNTEVRVFVNAPEANAQTSTQDRHYAGSFTFFGSSGDQAGHAGHQGQDYLFDLTETVRRLRTGDTDVTNEIKVQLVPVPIPGVPSDALQFKVAGVEVAIM